MLKPETVIILGAGSSLTFKLPLGSELRNDIAKSLNIRFDTFGSTLERGSYEIVEALKIHARRKGENSIQSYVNAGREIAEALPLCTSIDDVVERHSDQPNYSICAKLGIAGSILKYERRSGIAHDPSKIADPNISKFDGKWLSTLLQLVTRGCRPIELIDAFSKLNVINFNYDRCFEQFAFLWLKKVYQLNDSSASECVSSAKIIHPYGSLGRLPFQNPNSGISIGYEANSTELLDISSKICTYSESAGSEGEMNEIHSIIDNSKTLIFIGFAFHHQNMRLLTTGSKPAFSTRHFFATDVNIPEPRWDIFRNRISQCLDVTASNLFLNRSKDSCENLMHDFAESWSVY